MLLRRYHEQSEEIENEVNKGMEDETAEEITEDSEKSEEKPKKGKRKQV